MELYINYIDKNRNFNFVEVTDDHYVFNREHIIVGFYYKGAKFTIKDGLTAFEQFACLNTFNSDLIQDVNFENAGRRINFSSAMFMRISPCCNAPAANEDLPFEGGVT